MIEKVFFKTMNSLGPYEKNPHLAVAVSGGCDSLCLAILAKKWVDMKGGRITALIVDHSLRKNSNQQSKKTQNTLLFHTFKPQPTLIHSNPNPPLKSDYCLL